MQALLERPGGVLTQAVEPGRGPVPATCKAARPEAAGLRTVDGAVAVAVAMAATAAEAAAATVVADIPAAEDATARAARAKRGQRRLEALLIGAGAALVPWIGVLALQLPPLAEPSSWNDAWMGLDALEATGFIATGLLLRRRDERVCLAAAATAMLLFIDAWFDVMTATPAERPLSALMAIVAELPLGTLCARIALRRCGHAAPSADR